MAVFQLDYPSEQRATSPMTSGDLMLPWYTWWTPSDVATIVTQLTG